MAIGQIVKATIAEKGMTQRAVTQMMLKVSPVIKGFNEKKLSNIIHGVRLMTADELIAFCHALHVSPEIFMQTVR